MVFRPGEGQRAYGESSSVKSGMDTQGRIEELKERLSKAREAYYNLAGEGISDQEYDALRDELERLSPSHPEVGAVGAAPRFSVWEKVKHEIPMGSLNKVNSPEEFEEWAAGARSAGAETMVITHKIDGSSMELVYRGGKLVRCVTRGDGIVGEDVMANVSQMESVPESLRDGGEVTVRGEVVMFKDVFQKKYAEEYANPRNTAAAKVREKKDGGKGCRDLEFLAYWVDVKDGGPKTMFQSLRWLESHGFRTPRAKVCGDVDEVKAVFAEYAAGQREATPYEIDGMVVSVNDLKVLEEMGSHNMRPRGQVAWKFDAAMSESRVKDVKWQVGPTGRITPVAVLEPVEIGGVTVTNVSLHNLSMFRELRLTRGCRVLVSRRNDVIPYVERRLD
jgi:DNA ligase (NAD+)